MWSLTDVSNVFGHLREIWPDKGNFQSFWLVSGKKLPLSGQKRQNRGDDFDKITQKDPVLHLRRIPRGKVKMKKLVKLR